MQPFLVLAAVVCLLPGALTSVHLTVLVFAGLFYREPAGRFDDALSRFLLVVLAVAHGGGPLSELL